MTTKTVRSRFDHQVGEKVEGFVIVERREVIPPNPAEMRRGVYEYVVEVPPAPAASRAPRGTGTRRTKAAPELERPDGAEGFTRAAPGEMASVIRRIGGR
jgi:hypothetical protein